MEQDKILAEFKQLDDGVVGPDRYVVRAMKLLVLSNQRLENAMNRSDIQSRKLEESNYTLQKIMAILTGISTTIAVYLFLKEIQIVKMISAFITSIAHQIKFTLPNADAVNAYAGIIGAMFSVFIGFIGGIISFITQKKSPQDISDFVAGKTDRPKPKLQKEQVGIK